MGLSTAAVFSLLFLVGVVATVSLIKAQDDYTVILNMGNKKLFDRSFKDVHSDIEIIDVASVGGNLVITVNNTGNTVFEIDNIYLMINSSWIPDDAYSVSLLQSPSNGYWDPEESIEITYSAAVSGVVVKVVAETGVEDRYLYGL